LQLWTCHSYPVGAINDTTEGLRTSV
jgi:hypothetical protein